MATGAGRPRRRRRAALAVVALVATLVPLGSVLTSPALAANGTMVGTVTRSGSATPVGGIEVNAYGGIYAALYGSTTTAADGSYSLSLPAGSFWVRFRDPAGLHATVWYGGAAAMVGSTQVAVPSAGTVTADAVMVAPTTLGGTVRTAAGDVGLGGVTATVVDAATLAAAGTATTVEDGTWRVPVAAGTYKVRYDDPAANHPTTWSGGSTSGATAASIVVVGGMHATTDVTLSPRATVAGHVTDAASAPVAGIQAVLLEPVWGIVVATASTDALGAYALPAHAGTWRVRLHDPQGRYPDWYTGGVSSWPPSSTITISDGSTTTLDVQLDHNPTVHGTVTGPGGVPLAGIQVTALAADRSVVASAVTDTVGAFGFDVPVGPTRLRFLDPSGARAVQYLGPADAFDDAAVIDAVALGDHTADMAMVDAGSLSGRVTVGGFGPGARTAVVFGIDDERLEVFGATNVATDGTWTLGGLPPGPTKLVVVDNRIAQGLEKAYRPQFAGGHDVLAEGIAAGFGAAATFPVTSSTTTPTGTVGVVGYHCDPTVAVPGADLRAAFSAGLGVPVNLDGCDLHAADLRGTQLTGSLRYADLHDADLSSAVLGTSELLPGAGGVAYLKGDLTGARITGADLHHAWAFNTQLLATDPDWSGTDLRADTHRPNGLVGGLESWPVFWGGSGLLLTVGAIPLTVDSSVPYSGSPLVLDGAVMEHVLFGSMPGVAISGLSCSSCLFGSTYDTVQGAAVHADLSGASLPGLSCGGCTFVHADLSDVDLTGGSCAGCDLFAADLRRAQLSGLDLTGATIAGVDLRAAVGVTASQLASAGPDWHNLLIGDLGLDFTGMALPAGADLSGAQLFGNTFATTNLAGRTLHAADLHGVDLHGANLAFADLSYANLAGADLHGATVTGTDFTGANLAGADTTGWVTTTDLSGLDLRGADFSGQDLTGYRFAGSDLRGVSFQHANLTSADLTSADAGGASFDHATWTGADLTGADLTGAVLTNGAFGAVTGFTFAQLLSASKVWVGIDLTGTGFDFSGFDFKTPGYQLGNTVLSGMDLSGATIGAVNSPAGTDWTGADLSGLHAAGTTFSSSGLANVNLAGADLTGATFVNGGTLAGANLTGATVTGARLRSVGGLTFAQLATTNRNWTDVEAPAVSYAGADLRASGGWVLTGADLHGLNLSGAKLTGTSLAGAQLQGANLTWATLTNADLSGADLTSADVRSSVLGGAVLGGATITGARLSNAWLLTKSQLLGTDHTWTNTKLDAINLDLTGTDFTNGGFALTGVSFRKVNLTGSNLSGRDLTGVSLAQANLSGATFVGATGAPSGGSTAVYATTTCPDAAITDGGSVLTCVGHGFVT